MTRIDVHHHAILPRIAELMRQVGAPFKIPWTMESTERLLDECRIEHALISNPIPGDFFTAADTAARFNREANEAVAEFSAEHPGRFGLLAALPMPHVDAALAELAHAYDVLHADGVVLIPHSGGAYLGDPLYEPLLEELDRRAAVVLVHPMALPGTTAVNVPYVLADFLLDTTRGGLSLILSGALDRYPRIRWVLSHGGGFLPYAIDRVSWLGPGFFGYDRQRITDGLGRLYYDTALTGPNSLPSLLAAVPAERIVFGSDWCAAPAEAVTASLRGLDAAPLNAAQRRLIDRDNALRLFPRFSRLVAADSRAER
jgi:predicted TIM-barrel fold metal-dependent hydrolase